MPNGQGLDYYLPFPATKINKKPAFFTSIQKRSAVSTVCASKEAKMPKKSLKAVVVNEEEVKVGYAVSHVPAVATHATASEAMPVYEQVC
mmetsp:Transcript_81278/g.158762  ORF Transcript_81278/g.158762 Transcript_81278/m.158762 type:complete len:90 (-) Transcript_81278:163-432(-)